MNKKASRTELPRQDSSNDEEIKRVKTAHNVAHQCLNVVTKYLLIANAPAVQRVDPEFKEGILEDIRWHGWQTILGQPLKEILAQAGQKVIKCLQPLRSFSDRKFLEDWDASACADSASEFAILIAHDLWKEVQRCQHEFGLESTWGKGTLLDGLLFDRLRDEWRFRDIPIGRLGRFHMDELVMWEKSKKQPLPTLTVPCKSTFTTPEDAEILLRGFADRDSSVCGESADRLAGRIREFSGKTCSKNTVRKTPCWIEWNPKMVAKAKNNPSSPRRPIRLTDNLVNFAAADPLEKMIAEEEGQITEDGAKQIINKLPLETFERSAILQKLVEGEVTPVEAVRVAKKGAQRGRS